MVSGTQELVSLSLNNADGRHEHVEFAHFLNTERDCLMYVYPLFLLIPVPVPTAAGPHFDIVSPIPPILPRNDLVSSLKKSQQRPHDGIPAV
jgi:hypothetical protein